MAEASFQSGYKEGYKEGLAENKRFKDAVETAEKKYKLELNFENDARYIWPERWNIIKQALEEA